MGPLRYLIFYLTGGMIAGLLQAYIYPSSSTPAITAIGVFFIGTFIRNQPSNPTCIPMNPGHDNPCSEINNFLLKLS